MYIPSLSKPPNSLRSSSTVSSLLWKGNKFGDLCKIKELEAYPPRWDPTVVPIQNTGSNSTSASQVSSLKELPPPKPRPSTNLHYTCADYHAAYLSGKVTPRAVIDTLLPLIRRDTSPPGEHHLAFISVQIDLVRKAADASTERYRQGKPLSILDGVPIAMKDDGELDGYRRTLGSKLDLTNPQGGTEWSIKKMEEGGGIVIGKTVMVELGLDACGINAEYGTPLNPHNNNYYNGGSSTGSAYAVSSGLIPIAHGADACGSIRNPSSFVGVYGLKTTQGRISRLPTLDLMVTEGIAGPIACSLDDLALAYRIMATPDPSNPQSRNFPSPLSTLQPSLPKQKFLGVPESWISSLSPDHQISTLFQAAISHYTSLPDPYTLIPIEIPLPHQSQRAQGLVCLSHCSNAFADYTDPHPTASTLSSLNKLTLQTQALVRIPLRHATATTLVTAQRLRSLHMQHLSHIFTKYPGIIIVHPTNPCLGWPVASPMDVDLKNNNKSTYGFIDSDMSLRAMSFSWLANFTGCPAINRPMGYGAPEGKEGVLVKADLGEIPVGLTGMTEWGAEERLIEWAREGEGLLGEEGVRRPGGEGRWVDVLARAAGKGEEA